MVQVQRIEDWLGQQVVDRDGEDLGKLDDVFYDTESGAPVLISIKSGLLGRKSAVVPLDGATVDRDHLQVAHTKETIETAGQIMARPIFFMRVRIVMARRESRVASCVKKNRPGAGAIIVRALACPRTVPPHRVLPRCGGAGCISRDGRSARASRS